MKNYSSKLAMFVSMFGSVFGMGSDNRVAIEPYSDDYSEPGERKYSPDERRTRKRANRQKRREALDKKGWF